MPFPSITPYALPVLLLIGSSCFMTTAWYCTCAFANWRSGRSF